MESLTLSASQAVVRAGGSVTLTATLSSDSEARMAQEVTLLRRLPGGSYAPVSTAITDSSGSASWTDMPPDSATYQATFAGWWSHPIQSSEITVSVEFAVTAAASPVAVPPGGAVTLTIRAKPVVAGTPMQVERRIGTGAWTVIAAPVMTAAGSVTVPLGRPKALGRYELRVVHPGDGVRAAGSAVAQTEVTVTGRGKATSWVPSAGTRRNPVRWNPCRTIGYVVNPRYMPPSGMADLREALRRVTIATGLRFRYAGTTTARPRAMWDNVGVADQRFLVVWMPEKEMSRYARVPAGMSPPVGIGGASWRDTSTRYHTGRVIINATWAAKAEPGFGGPGQTLGGVLMHELGHLVGLRHPYEARINDNWALMNNTSVPAAVWGAGDLTGLRMLGRSRGCRR